jgi:nucleotide-binding universal stress UspA family protein
MCPLVDAVPALTALDLESPNAPLLVATDGERDSDGSVRVGVALARRDGTRAELFSVVEPIIRFAEDGIAADVESLTSLALESRDDALRASVTHASGHSDWPFTLDTGDRVERIVETANARGASIIILGLGAHGITARLAQREDRRARDAVRPRPGAGRASDAWGVPHTALAAIDFTESSERAARAALALLGTEGKLYLAHVTPRIPIPQADSRQWDDVTQPTVLPRLVEMAKRLAPPPGVEVEYVRLHGEPAHELLAFADQYHIDLVAAGAHGKTALERIVLGSVSTTLVRNGALLGARRASRALGVPRVVNRRARVHVMVSLQRARVIGRWLTMLNLLWVARLTCASHSCNRLVARSPPVADVRHQTGWPPQQPLGSSIATLLTDRRSRTGGATFAGRASPWSLRAIARTVPRPHARSV